MPIKLLEGLWLHFTNAIILITITIKQKHAITKTTTSSERKTQGADDENVDVDVAAAAKRRASQKVGDEEQRNSGGGRESEREKRESERGRGDDANFSRIKLSINQKIGVLTGCLMYTQFGNSHFPGILPFLILRITNLKNIIRRVEFMYVIEFICN